MPERRRGRPPYPDTLTPSERRVLEELRKGGTNAEVAVRIGVGPETVKTHISNMLAKLALEDRQQLAAWREEDAPRRPRWLLAPFLLRPLVAVGVAAGVAVVVVALLVVLSLVGGDEDPLYIEGVGEISGPVAIFVVADFVAEEPVERSQGSSNRIDARHHAVALDLETGRDWIITELVGMEHRSTDEVIEGLAVAGDRLLVWTGEGIHGVTLDGRWEAVPFRSTAPISGLVVSPDGSKAAVVLDRPSPHEADGIVVIDLRSGGEVLRLDLDDPRIGPPNPRIQAFGILELRRWSTEGRGLWFRSRLSASRSLHAILTLEGDLHVLTEEIGELITFPSDLRHAIAHSGWQDQLGFDSLTVTELSTGRIVLMLEAGEGHFLWHVAGPFAGRYVYATIAVDDLDQVLSRPEGLGGAWVNLAALHEGIALHDVDLATGDGILVSEGHGDAAEIVLQAERDAAQADRCFEDVAAYEACQATAERVFEWDAGAVRRFLGYIWLGP